MSLRDTPAIIDMLRKNNKGSFETNAKSISYKTGFATLDYYVGYKRCVFDKDGNLLESSPCVGIPGGCFATFVDVYKRQPLQILSSTYLLSAEWILLLSF